MKQNKLKAKRQSQSLSSGGSQCNGKSTGKQAQYADYSKGQWIPINSGKRCPPSEQGGDPEQGALNT